MPLVRLQVKNMCGLGQTELHRNVDLEDPKAILDGVAVSGLVGILRQLGDLTEFATEIFHGIQEEIMVTASRSNKLKMRLNQIEATVPSIHNTVLAQTNHISFAYTSGLEWHPRIPNLQNHFIYDDLPQFIMSPYEDCLEPPQLHLLDKFDINGPGSCFKRYSDPTHFNRVSRTSKVPEIKKKKSVLRSRDRSSLVSIANQSDRETFTSSCSKTASMTETESKSDFQDHVSCSFDSRSGREKLKGVVSVTIASVLSQSESEDGNDTPSDQDLTARGSSCVSWQEKAEIVECATEEAPEVMETNFVVDVEAARDIKPNEMEMYSETETESEEDDFVDALYTIDSESENDQGLQITEDVKKKIANEITEERLEPEKISNNSIDDDDEIISVAASDPPWEASEISNGTHNYSNGFSNPLYDINCIQEHQESEDETSCDIEDTKIWTNGKIIEATIPENDDAETFKETLREDKAPFDDWFTSSPPLDHMKISFNHSETLQSSKLKLKLSDEYKFSSFQLVPETAATSLPDSDSDKETSSRSSSYISDNSEKHSVSMSEKQWEEESDQIHERKSQQELYDSFQRTETEDSSLKAPSPKIKTSNGYLQNLSYLQNPAESLPPPLPPLQWMVSKVSSGRFEENNKQSLKNTLICTFEQNNSLSTKKEEPNTVTASDLKPENKDYKQSHGNSKEMEVGDFLHQIRTKQFNLRRVVTTRTSSEAKMNSNISVILEKANSIRQAVASDDEDGQSDTWSDSDT